MNTIAWQLTRCMITLKVGSMYLVIIFTMWFVKSLRKLDRKLHLRYIFLENTLITKLISWTSL